MMPPVIVRSAEWLKNKNAAGLAAAAVFLAALLLVAGYSLQLDRTAEPGRPAGPTAEVLKSAEAAGLTPAQVEAVRNIVKDYLMNNPDILIEVSRELEARQQLKMADEHKRVIAERKAKIFSSPTDFVLGNPKGDITVVEFFDYNCGWCKRAVDDVQKLAQADPNVRIVMKEFPIFGEHSTYAAKAAMASIRQGKYWDFHLALMREKQVTKENVMTVAARVGLDVNRLKADMEDPKLDAAIKETHDIAQALAIEGTPGFIVDAKVSVGYLPVEGLRQLVGEARKNGCQVC
ncbi:MAG TPA: DsbA family protein [Hyphomicrobiaceae bacterium]|nr:DsbA family protein [Hyphomicrobiaceae bacterium]